LTHQNSCLEPTPASRLWWVTKPPSYLQLREAFASLTAHLGLAGAKARLKTTGSTAHLGLAGG